MSQKKPEAATAQERVQDALRLHESGQFAEAEAIYWAVLDEEPNYAEVLCMLGVLAHQTGRNELAVEHLKKAIALDPAAAAYHGYLAAVYRSMAMIDEAIFHFRQSAYLDPGQVEVSRNLGRALLTKGRPHEAIPYFRKFLAMRPGEAEDHYYLGLALRNQGKFEEAIDAVSHAIALDPLLSPAYYFMAEIKRYGLGDPLFVKIEELLQNSKLSPADRGNLHFALAKMHDDCDEFQQAFAHAKTANELQPGNYSGDALADMVTRVVKVFDKTFFAERADFGSQSELPIFIVGLPRSGKSLIEHFLAYYPGVAALGESRGIETVVNSLAKRVKASPPYPDCMPLLSRPAVAEQAELRLQQLHSDAAHQVIAGDLLHAIDTTPPNVKYLGAIALLFPKARIIHCRRDPMDAGLALYFRNINHFQPYAADFADFGHYCRQSQKLMAHWRAVLPGPYLEVDYEALVAAPEAESKRIVEFCGLKWNPACLESPYVSSPVQTGPGEHGAISDRFVGRWRHYERWLGPLKEALAEGGPGTG